MSKMTEVAKLFDRSLLDKVDVYDLKSDENIPENPHQFSSSGMLDSKGDLAAENVLRNLLIGNYGVRAWITLEVGDLKKCCKMSNSYHSRQISFSDWESYIIKNKDKFDNPDFLQVLVSPI